MQRNSKAIAEQIDEADLQFSRHEVQCRGMLNQAKTEGREFTSSENQRFNTAVQQAKQIKQQLTELRSELAQAEAAEQRTKAIFQGQNMAHPSGMVYGNQFQGDTILPVNGVLSGEGKVRYSPYGRMAKLKAFRDDQTAFDSAMWYRAVLAREVNHGIDQRAEDHCNSVGLQIVNSGYEGSGPAGGYLLPSPVSSAIIEVREQVGIARKVCNVLPTSSDTLTVPKKTGGLTVYIVGETQAITDSDKTWGDVGLIVKKRTCLSYLSHELSDDAIINIVDNIVSEQAYALALQEDDELINGTGASTYGGIQGLLSSIGSAGVSTATSTTWAALTMAEVTAAVGLLPDRYFPYEPSFICSHSFFNQVLLRLAMAAGGVTLAEVMAGSPNVRSFMGYKVYLTSKMPTATATGTKCALFGAFNQAAILADRGGIRVQRSDDIKFVEDMIALKAVSRYDMNVHDHGDGTNAGAYIALSTHS